jgi:hypothetical protein
VTRALPVAKLTLAVTPSSLLSFFCTRTAQAAQVMPATDSSIHGRFLPGECAG